MPGLFVTFQQISDVPSKNHLHAVDAAFTVDPTRFQIIAYGKDWLACVASDKQYHGQDRWNEIN